MKRYLSILFLLFGLLLCFAQQYPVRLVPVVFPPYNVRLSDYALNSEPKLQLQVLMTDLLEPPHKTGIKFSLESGGRVIAVSTPFVNGLEPFLLQPGNNISLSNLDLKPLFKLENLSGISPSNYAKALPDGLYQYCFQAYDFYTKNNLSQKSCASVYQVLYEPPFLNLPQKGEKVTKKAEFQGLAFNWSPRQTAPNTKYFFTLKEIWDKQRDPESAFLAARVLCKEETFAPSLYYGVDKTQLIPGKRYAWQVQAVSGTPQYNHSPIQEGGVYKNNGLSEIFFFDYVENCPVPAFLMAKTAARGRAEIQWMLQGASSKLFRVEYRKKGSSSPWLSETSYQNSAILSGLENNTEYEYRVGAVCGENKSFDPDDLSQADAFAYSGVQYFTTNFSNPNKNSAQCGVMPHVDLANKKPYDRPLTPNEVFTAGDFPVTVITAQGTAGNYTGEGFIQVPYLADTKIKVTFNNIQLNSEKQLINGTVETAYDTEEGNVARIENFLKEEYTEVEQIINKGIQDKKLSKDSYQKLEEKSEILVDKLREKIDELEKENFISPQEAKEYRAELEETEKILKDAVCVVDDVQQHMEQEPSYGKSFFDDEQISLIYDKGNCERKLEEYKEKIQKIKNKVAEKIDFLDTLKKFWDVIKQCKTDYKNQQEGYIPRCLWDHDNYVPNGIFIPYSFDPAFASGFVDGAIETVDGIIKIVEVISCHDITSPTFYTDRCKDVRTQTWNTMRDIMNIIIYEDKREAFFRDIGTMFSEYVDETLGLDNQARYNQGKLAFDAVSMFFGAGEIKAATKSGRLIQTLSTNLKKLNPKVIAKKLKHLPKKINWNKFPKIRIKDKNISKDGWLMGRYVNGKLEVIGKTKIAQKWDFIVTTKGEILVGRKHSWLSKGEDVLAAGEIKYNNGKLVEISNASGHYLPTIEETSNFLKIFKNAHVDIENVTLTILQKDGTIYKQILSKSKERILYIK